MESFQRSDLAAFLDPYFIRNNSGLPVSSTAMSNSWFLIFTGLLKTFLLVWNFIYFLILVFIPTALLICAENTFWNINGDGNFVELFKKSFTLYVESGLREMTERDIDMLKNGQGEFSVTKDFNAKFYKFIVHHYLRKFHCFYLHLTHLIVVFVYYIQPNLGNPEPMPVENQPVENPSPWNNLVKCWHWNRKRKENLLGFKSQCKNSERDKGHDGDQI